MSPFSQEVKNYENSCIKNSHKIQIYKSHTQSSGKQLLFYMIIYCGGIDYKTFTGRNFFSCCKKLNCYLKKLKIIFSAWCVIMLAVIHFYVMSKQIRHQFKYFNFNGRACFFAFSLIIEGTTEEVLQFLMQIMSIFFQNIDFNEKMYF